MSTAELLVLDTINDPDAVNAFTAILREFENGEFTNTRDVFTGDDQNELVEYAVGMYAGDYPNGIEVK